MCSDITCICSTVYVFSANPRSSLHTMLGAQTIGTLISVRAEPQEKGLGIKLSSTEGAGCIVMEVADHSPLVSIIQQGDRYSTTLFYQPCNYNL